MFGKIIIKEWRDNRLLLLLAGLVLTALIVLGIAGHRTATVGLAGVFLLCVLPVTALLLGSGAFGAEFKNDAWSYLFSRPVRKSTIWFSKYLALLSFLAAAFLILTLAVAVLPGLKTVLKDFYAPSFFGNTALYGLAIFLAFTIPYSLSILSEKPLLTLAVSVLLGALVFWLHVQYVRVLMERYDFWGTFASYAFGILIAASFILASILTLTRVDFSQPAKKLASFACLLLLFLAASFVAGTLIISRGNPFAKPRIWAWLSSQVQGNVYLQTQGERVIRYDSKEDRVRKMPAGFKDADIEFSSAGGKIGFLKIDRTWTGNRRAEAYVANLDGTGLVSLARFYGKDSAFNGWTPESNILFSVDGRQAAFVASPPGRDRAKNPARLFWMNIDGSALKDKPLDFYRKGSVKLLSWLEDERSLVLRLAEKDVHSVTVKIIKYSLDRGVAQTLETTLPRPNNYEWMPASLLSPERKSLIVKLWDETRNKEKVVLLDLDSFLPTEISTDVPLWWWGIAWTQQGDRFASRGSRDMSLWVYALADGSFKKVWEQADKRVGFSYDWLLDGRLIILARGKDGEDRLIILSEDFASKKQIKIPGRFLQKTKWGSSVLTAGDDKVLVLSEAEVWRLDLKAEEWKKVY